MKILSILTLLFGLTQCSTAKFVEKAPFTVKKAFYNNWSGGQAGVGGVKLELHLKNAENIQFDSLYFQKKKTKVTLQQKEKQTNILGYFAKHKTIKKDLILDADPTKELQNTPPIINKYPFDLKDSEAVISFKKGSKTVFYKIENIKKEQPVFFPSANKK
ncbi:hypothetical protein [uncultured Polaribacter sp.]|uniref:hypothetical protein n=1 Tax=uncultured Polaribacter sp. TaxID=174711 RepID=UPI002635B4A6|nr:hypothetical protein [uncultured Polaribacter sp.]